MKTNVILDENTYKSLKEIVDKYEDDNRISSDGSLNYRSEINELSMKIRSLENKHARDFDFFVKELQHMSDRLINSRARKVDLISLKEEIIICIRSIVGERKWAKYQHRDKTIDKFYDSLPRNHF